MGLYLNGSNAIFNQAINALENSYKRCKKINKWLQIDLRNDGIFSFQLIATSGVLQGSHLRPNLFLLLVNIRKHLS